MKLLVNGASVQIDGPLTLSGLLARHKLNAETVIVEYNLQVPAKHEYGLIEIAEGDRIEIVKFMGGG